MNNNVIKRKFQIHNPDFFRWKIKREGLSPALFIFIKTSFNTYNGLVYKDHQLERQCRQPVLALTLSV